MFPWSGSGFLFEIEARHVKVDTLNFNSNLSSVHNTVQKALDALDDLISSGGAPDFTSQFMLMGA